MGHGENGGGGMTFKKRMFELSRRLIVEESGQLACPPETTRHSRPLSFGPEVKFIHITKVATDGARLNIPVQIAPIPLGEKNEWTIALIACDNAHLVDSFFLSFNQVSPGS